MNYRWLDCPNCGCHVAINWTETVDGLLGSLRRWDSDRSINDGRPFRIERGADPATPFAGAAASCVCGAVIPLPERPDAVGGERTEDLRVTLT